jgi:hypothetical protein
VDKEESLKRQKNDPFHGMFIIILSPRARLANSSSLFCSSLLFSLPHGVTVEGKTKHKTKK